MCSWAHIAEMQRQAKHRAVRAQTRMRLFGLRRSLLAWYYCTRNLKLHRLHTQLADRQSTLLKLHAQAKEGGRTVHELQLERAQLHQRLGRVADHAKVQVGQLAVANDKMLALQQRDEDHQLTLGECKSLRSALSRTELQLTEARNSCRHLELQLSEAVEAGTRAATTGQHNQEEVHNTCVSLQRHLTKRKATMEACVRLLEAAGHR